MHMTHFARRRFCGAAAGLAAGLVAPRLRAQTTARTDLNPDQALALLKEGNERFMAGELPQRPQDRERRLEIA